MADGKIPYMFKGEDITSAVSFIEDCVNPNYTFFRKIGNIVFFQIYFTANVSTTTKIATINNDRYKPYRQNWSIIASGGGGSSTSRLSVNGDGIYVYGNVLSECFTSGWYMTN